MEFEGRAFGAFYVSATMAVAALLVGLAGWVAAQPPISDPTAPKAAA